VPDNQNVAAVLAGAPPPYLLSDVTRKERRSLLLSCLVGTAATWGHLIPTEVSAFGITVSEVEQRSLFLLLFLVVLYFSAAFLLYAIPEYRQWRVRHQLFREELAAFFAPQAERLQNVDASNITNEAILALSTASRHIKLGTSLMAGAAVRALFDFGVPLPAALVAMTFLLAAAIPAPVTQVALSVSGLVGCVGLGFAIYFARAKWVSTRTARMIKRNNKTMTRLLARARMIAALPEGPERDALKARIQAEIDAAARAMQEGYGAAKK
jgi:hypothetical protein